MPELKSITKHFSKFMINDILKKDEKKDSKHHNVVRREQNNSKQHVVVRREESDKSFLPEDDNEIGKKPRQCFTTLQVEELEKLFLTTNYPDTYTRQQLANKMDVSETRIQIWFQNRRAKIRRQKKHHRRSYQGPDYFHQYRNPMDLKSPVPPTHRYSLPPMDSKSPPPPYHRYSSPPLDNFFLRQLSSSNMEHCHACSAGNNLHNHPNNHFQNHMPYFDHKLLNPACLRVCETSDYDIRSRSLSR